MAKKAQTKKTAVKAKAAEGDPRPPELKDKATATSQLSWEETQKGEWRAADGERGGARIRGLGNGYLGKDTITFYVYRDGEYLGCNSSLDGAKLRAERREKASDALKETLPGGHQPAFLSLSPEESAASWRQHSERKQREKATSSNPSTVSGNPATTTAEAVIEVDMTEYEGLDLDGLLKAYNELVVVAHEKGLDRYRKFTRFADREQGLKSIQQIKGSIKASDDGSRAEKRQAASKRKAPKPVEPSPAKPKEPAKPTPDRPAGKVGDFLNAVGARPGTNQEKLATFLIQNVGKEVAMTAACKAVYGVNENPAIAAVIAGLQKAITAKGAQYTIKRKEKTIGLYSAGK